MTAESQVYARGEDRQVRLDGAAKEALTRTHARLTAVAGIFALGFLVLAGRVVQLTLVHDLVRPAAPVLASESPRPDIVDRNGVLLATTLHAVSLFADSRAVPDPRTTALELAAILPELDPVVTEARLASGQSFVWIRRHLTPRQQDAVNRLGIPGLNFQSEPRRLYPQGREAAHVLGYAGIDNEGLAGIEKSIDGGAPVKRRDSGVATVGLSIDIRIQHAVREELARSVGEFSAIGAAAVVLDVKTGETLALVSLPDFDPNDLSDSLPDQRFNRAALGVYEMGSTFKAFTLANALELGTVDLDSGYDASEPLHVARFLIRDDHAQNRWLSVPEIFIYSSNIGAAKMALDIGTERQRDFLGRLGLLQRAEIEIPEIGMPLVPEPWREINTMTIAFGHGLAVSPVQLAVGFSSLVNGGVAVVPTLFKRIPGEAVPGVRVISESVSQDMRRLLRRAVEEGTGKQAAAPGYLVGGKTGTAEKANAGGYNGRALISSFVGIFPITDPQFVVLVMLDEPKGNESTFNYAAAGWNAAPTVGRIIARIGPMLGVAPVDEADRSMLAAAWKP